MGQGFSIGMMFKIQPADPVKHAQLFKSEIAAGNQSILITDENVPGQFGSFEIPQKIGGGKTLKVISNF